jgi:hypothetical protein
MIRDRAVEALERIAEIVLGVMAIGGAGARALLP